MNKSLTQHPRPKHKLGSENTHLVDKVFIKSWKIVSWISHVWADFMEGFKRKSSFSIEVCLTFFIFQNQCVFFKCARKVTPLTSVCATIFMKFFQVVHYYLMKLSSKFPKDLSFFYGDICKIYWHFLEN